MNKLIAACVKYLEIRRPYRVILQNKIKNPDWFAYHNAVIDDRGKVLRHTIRVTMEEISLYPEYGVSLDTIIAHEFIHAWQTEYKIKGKVHGKQFQNKAKELEFFLKLRGFNIKPLYRPDIDKP